MNAYTYCITHLPSGKRYYGCQYSMRCDPSHLGVSYFSSSRRIHKLIEQEGLDAFKFDVRKVFRAEKEKCRRWEHKVLVRLNAAKSEKWFNRHNADLKFYNSGDIMDDTREKMRIARQGKKHSKETIEKIRQSRIGKKMSIESRAKMTLSHKGIKLSEEHKKKLSDGQLGLKRPHTTPRVRNQHGRFS